MNFGLGPGSPATQAAYQQTRAHARKGEVSFSYMLVIYNDESKYIYM